MKIYTSYFSNYRNFGDLHPVSIALYLPKYFKGDKEYLLAPSKEILALKDNVDLYTKKFNDELSRIDAKLIFKLLKNFSSDKDVVLLCYEKPPQFCHRHLVAKWLEKELNIKVEELKYK